MKTVLSTVLALAFATSSAMANRVVFKQIAEDAQPANGMVTVSSYNKNITKKELVEKGLKALKAEYRKNCGPWKTITTRRLAMRAIAKLEEYSDPDKVTPQLQELYENGEIVAIVGAISNGDVSCSLSYFNVYGADGALLEMRYDSGD